MQDTNNETTDFAEYLRPLRARWWLIVVIALVAAVGTYRYYSGKPVFYTASTSLYMQGSNTSALTGGSTAGQNDPTYIPNQAILLHTEGVAAVAAKLLGYHGYPGSLLGAVAAAPQTGTDFMNVSATAANPVDAARIANAFAQAYITTQETSGQQLINQALKAQQQRLASIPLDVGHAQERANIQSVISGLQLEQSVPTAPAKQVQPAVYGSASTSNPTSHAIFGLIIGLVIASALAYAIDALDRRVKRVGEIEELYGSPVIAKVPWAAPNVLGADPRRGLQSPLAEAFRGLRTALQLRPAEHASLNGGTNGGGTHSLRTILVASAIPGEGKSTVARNLALAYLEAGQRVAVVDCDLRHPELTEEFGVEPKPGLPEVLTGVATVADSLQTVEVANQNLDPVIRARQGAREESMYVVATGGGRQEFSLRELVEQAKGGRGEPELAVLPSSPPDWNPSAIFETGAMQDILRTLRADYDIVILDSSPLVAVSDAAPLLGEVDGVLVVSRIRKSPLGAVRELKTVLDRVPHSTVVGVVANDVRDRSGTYVYSRAYNANS